MEITNFTPWPALLGGLMIGTAAALVYGLNGRIAGISGIAARLMRAVPGDSAWRVMFLVGMVGGGALLFALQPRLAVHDAQTNTWGLLVAGLLVGLGTRLGGGCTSGHGVCGIPRGSLRSVVATLTFMGFGFATVFVVRHLIGGGA